MDHAHDHGPRDRGHSHGVLDPSIASTARGLWALKWSCGALILTAGFQVVVVVLSGSVALLADSIHNLGDAATAVPLAVAFLLARRPATRRFTYGLGRVEDFAGLVVVLTIAASAVAACYQAILRLLRPEPVHLLWAVVLASIVGFLGNEAVAVFRIRVGRHSSRTAITPGWTAGPASRCCSASSGCGRAIPWPIPSSPSASRPRSSPSSGRRQGRWSSGCWTAWTPERSSRCHTRPPTSPASSS